MLQARLLNLFLTEWQAQVLPWKVTLLDDPQALAKAAIANPYQPIVTAIAEFDSGAHENEVVEEVEYFVTLLGFVTRSPVFADVLRTVGDGWIHDRAIGLPRFEKQRGLHMTQHHEDLRKFFDAAWPLRLDRPRLNQRRLVEALEWHAFGRGGHGLRYLEMQVTPHWVALEVLASAWAEGGGKNELLTDNLIEEIKGCTKPILTEACLGKPQRKEVYAKLKELERRPIRQVILEYLSDVLGPYESQPKEQLEKLIDEANQMRNTTLHTGSLRLADLEEKERSQALDTINELESLVARALLAEFGAKINLLTSVPWPEWQIAA